MTPVSLVLLLVLLHVHLSKQAKFAPTLAPSAKQSLKYIAVITRHGSRSPIKSFQNDAFPYTDSKFWPNGPGELTSLGKVQMYHTGLYLKARYRGFIDGAYTPYVADVMYNPYNRDYMSSALLAAGLFPPVGPQVWNPSLLWQPVVQRIRAFDICDLANGELCAKFKKLSLCEVDKFNQESCKHKELIGLVSNCTGMNYTNLSDMYEVYDTLLMQAQNGFKLAPWTKQVFPFQLKPFAIGYLIQAYAGTTELIQLGAGPELKYISDVLTMKANGTYGEAKKIYVEAAHDCTLISLLKAMGNKDPFLEIQTGAYLLFELHCVLPDYVVQPYYFRTSYDEKPESIEIEGCPCPCTLEAFNKFVDSINPADYEQACRVCD